MNTYNTVLEIHSYNPHHAHKEVKLGCHVYPQTAYSLSSSIAWDLHNINISICNPDISVVDILCIVVSRGASPKSLRFWELPWYLTLRLTHLFEKNPFSPLRNLSSSFTESPEGRRWHDARVGGLHYIHQDGAWPRGGRKQTEFAGHVLCSHW